MFCVAQRFSKSTISTLLGNLLEMQILGPSPQTTESEILGMRPPNLFCPPNDSGTHQGLTDTGYLGRMEIQDTCGPGDRKPIVLPESGKKLPTSETCPIGYQVLTNSMSSLYLMEESVKELTSPEAKVESREVENYSNWEGIDCSSVPKINPGTCPSIKWE